MAAWRAAAAALLVAAAAPWLFAQEYQPNLPLDHPAIAYFDTRADDAVGRLAREIERGAVALEPRADAAGYVPEILERLHITVDSQMLVFSKTSFQAPRISPDNPRAIYFNDDVAVAYVRGGPDVELTAVDPVLGSVFYEMSVDQDGTPHFARPQVCLQCHQGPNTEGVPGIYVGSVIPGPSGAPLRDKSAIVTDHRSDFAERWGGWYVTARRGEQPDRANAVALNPADPGTLVRESQQNLPSLIGRVDLSGYLAQTSDIVALMTFEHQTQMTNLITRVGWQARMAARDERGADGREEAVERAVEDLVAYMLFADEARLVEPIEGVSSFTRTFAERGPRDQHGRSLRDFDLRTRLFRYPLSYMIYGAAFDALPDTVRDRIYRRLHAILTGADSSPEYRHLSATDRTAILEILRDTKPSVPAYWRDARTP